MITERQIRNLKMYCKDYTRIPGFASAIADKSNRYVCHHILEVLLNVSRDWLIEHNLYYDQPPCLLQIMTFSDHSRLHINITANNHGGGLMLGKSHSVESRKKMSEHMSSLSYEQGHRYIHVEKSVLYDLYYIKKTPITKMSEILGISAPTVRKKLRYFNIY